MTRWLAGVAAAALVTATLSGAPAVAGTKPNTTIKAGPSGLVASATATFKFKSSKKGSTFKCRMDNGRWKKCSSPAVYKNLGQGAHAFSVRATKDGKVDRTPATRAFTVDTVAPETALLTGPDVVSGDHTPTFTFSSSEASTFSCRLGTAAFTPCASPFTPAEIPDEVYTFEVVARDTAGNADSTPASRTFEILTPITKDLATAEAAAAYLLPDSSDIDIAANCASSPAIDCPEGVPLPPADQVHVTSTRSVTEVLGQDRYDVDATVNVTTLIPVKITYMGTTCDLAATSANGANPAWRLTASLNFVHPPSSSEWRIQTANVSLTNVDDDDLVITGGGACTLMGSFVGAFKDLMIDALTGQFSVTFCAARGPAYLEPCPAP